MIFLTGKNGMIVGCLIVGNKRHPFVNTILGKYIDHLKGDHRKNQGKSNKGIQDLVVNHKNDYWVK